MAKYKLTKKADTDFENIFIFGIDTFGLIQAEKYQVGMIKQFVQIAESPLLYTSVEDIKSGYRRSVYRSHSIYYTILDKETVLIVRILNAQNIEKAFKLD